jgi:acid phosphatase
MSSSAKRLLVCAGVLAASACRDQGSPSIAVPLHGHVLIVVEENKNYATVVGTGAMPYLDTLIARYGLATQYYANTHPSIGNYFMLTVGRLVTNNNGYADTVRDDNIVRRLVAAGKTWKSYAEGLPAVGYTGDGPAPYTRRHNPLSYLSDVMGDTVQKKRLVPFSQFAGDWAGGALPDYSFIVPNLCNDAHDCSPATADAWLSSNIKPLIDNARFQQDGLLIIVFDESEDDDLHGGGRIVWVVVNAKARPGYRSTTLYQHESTLRLTAQALGLAGFPGAAATAPGMDEFFVP